MTILSQIYSLIQRIELFEDTNLLVLHSSPPVEVFKLFISDDFVTKMAEHTQLLCFSKRHTTIIQASI